MNSTSSIKRQVLQVSGALLLPPGLFSVLIFTCLLFQQQRFTQALLFITALALYLLSITATQKLLIRLIKIHPWANLAQANQKNQAIVVLGGGHHANTPDYGGDTVNHLTLERLRYAAIVQKQTGLPLLVSGGESLRGAKPEAELMRDILIREFLSVVNWIEADSHTTYENAQYSARILKQNNIHEIILVTHAYHMPRAMEAFQRAGLAVTPAATIFIDWMPASPKINRWLPSFHAFYWNNLIIYELAGRLWYHVHYYSKAT